VKKGVRGVNETKTTTKQYTRAQQQSEHKALYNKRKVVKPEDIIRRKVLREFRGELGGRLKFIGTGGAAISSKVLEFLQKCYCACSCILVEGYGTTEVLYCYACVYQ